MEELKVFMQCTMLAASSADFIQVLKNSKPKIANILTKAYWIGAVASLGLTLFF